MAKENPIEKGLWSIAFPGFGQILNKKLLKGILFITLAVIININANLNEAIVLSFQGNTIEAVKVTNYLWLMNYPGIYVFSIWDAYMDSGGYKAPYAFLPFVFSVYSGVIGVVYSSVFKVNGFLLGPVWLPIICLILGALLGAAIRLFIIKYNNKKVKNQV